MSPRRSFHSLNIKLQPLPPRFKVQKKKRPKEESSSCGFCAQSPGLDFSGGFSTSLLFVLVWREVPSCRGGNEPPGNTAHEAGKSFTLRKIHRRSPRKKKILKTQSPFRVSGDDFLWNKSASDERKTKKNELNVNVDPPVMFSWLNKSKRGET